MKIINKLNIVTILLVFITLNLEAQRRIAWVHTLDKDASFWETQATNPLLNDRNHVRNNLSSDIDAAGVQLFLSVPDNPRNIGIAHGLGGLLVRELDHAYPNKFGGMIMFGAPLNGLVLANSLTNGHAANFVEYHNEVVDRGPDAATNYDASFLLSFLLFQWNPIWASYKQVFFEWAAGKDAVNVTEDDILVLDDELINDLNQYTASGRNYTNNDPKILVFGDEDSRVNIKLISSDASDGVNDNAEEGNYQSVIDYYRSTAATWEPAGFCILHCGERRSIAQKFREGESYLKSHMEWRWHGLIGAQGTTTSTYTYMRNVCGNNYLGQARMPLPNDEDCYVLTTGTHSVNVALPNDGLIGEASATGRSSIWASQNTRTARLDGVNHFEMGEHFETKRLLEAILVDQNSDYNGFFKGKD